MKRFNTTGVCDPNEDYMVDITGKIEQIKRLVDRRSYFTINRARQYGKSTTLNTLKKTLSNAYICINLSFEGVGATMFADPQSFCQRFLWQLEMAANEIKWKNDEVTDFDQLSVHLTQICKDKKIILMIDEVDKASNHEVFLYFLGMLRNKFNERKSGVGATFHSVILAGVHDIKNITCNECERSSHAVHANRLSKMSEGKYLPVESEDKKYDSPWNIAVNFNIDMSFCPREISTMLRDYESEHKTNMNIVEISDEIYNYTSGYPFLVSGICQYIDEELNEDWTIHGVREAVRILLSEKNTLFDDLFKNLENNKNLYKLIYDILIVGNKRTFTPDNPTINCSSLREILITESGEEKLTKDGESRIM
jgi:hypothetical protein